MPLINWEILRLQTTPTCLWQENLLCFWKSNKWRAWNHCFMVPSKSSVFEYKKHLICQENRIYFLTSSLIGPRSDMVALQQKLIYPGYHSPLYSVICTILYIFCCKNKYLFSIYSILYLALLSFAIFGTKWSHWWYQISQNKKNKAIHLLHRLLCRLRVLSQNRG